MADRYENFVRENDVGECARKSAAKMGAEFFNPRRYEEAGENEEGVARDGGCKINEKAFKESKARR